MDDNPDNDVLTHLYNKSSEDELFEAAKISRDAALIAYGALLHIGAKDVCEQIAPMIWRYEK